MRKKLFALVLVWMLSFGISYVNAAPDRETAGALADIVKYEKQFAGQTSVSKSTANRTLKLLKITKQRLDSSGNKSESFWVDANKRYNALVAYLNQFINPPQVAAPQVANTQKPVATHQSASRQQLEQMISQQRVRVIKLGRDLESNIDSIDTNGVKQFQDPNYVAKYQKLLDRHTQSFNKYAKFAGDPDVEKTRASLSTMNKMMKFGREHAAKELAFLGDVQATLRDIEAQLRMIKVMPVPTEPYGKGVMARWLSSVTKFREENLEIIKSLPEIKQRAYLPFHRSTVQEGGPYDEQDVDRLYNWGAGEAEMAEASIKKLSFDLDQSMQMEAKFASEVERFDPTDDYMQVLHYLSKGTLDNVRINYSNKIGRVNEAIEFARLLKQPSYQSRVDLLKKIKSNLANYETDYKTALKTVRMPDPVTNDSDLKEIANATFANYDYIGEFRNLVVIKDKEHRSKETSTDKYDKIDVSLSNEVTITGTRTTYHYEWDEFSVATAQKDEGKYYIYWTTFKYFTQGASTTPLNKWIISNHSQRSEIPESNLD